MTTMTGLWMATTSKTLEALVVREDSLEESPADPKLEPPIDPKDMPKVANP
jgi:hypothetical protein